MQTESSAGEHAALDYGQPVRLASQFPAAEALEALQPHAALRRIRTSWPELRTHQHNALVVHLHRSVMPAICVTYAYGAI